MIYTEEKLSEEFTKHHVGFDGLPLVVHHFTGIDKGLPHNHPAMFRTYILKGSYIERVYQLIRDYRTNQVNGWSYQDFIRKEGTSHEVFASTIHEIIDLPEGECWTTSIGNPAEQEWGFYDFREDGVFYRQHNQDNWIKL